MRYVAIILLGLLLASAHIAGQESERAEAVMIEVKGPIGPAISDFIARNIEKAGEQGSKAVILRMDTPGGLDTAMRDIIKAILSSPLPVVTYVSPSGARAASAGTYILYASHVAVMAPATNLGAATPIPIGPGAMPEEDKGKKSDGKEGESSDKSKQNGSSSTPQGAMQRKIVNDAVAYIRSLADLRGRNADWAEKAVRSGESLTAEAALEQNVIDFMADDVDALLTKLDGRKVKMQSGELIIETENWTVANVEPDWRTKFLAVITNPNVAYLLMLLGVYGLLFELYNPGALIPGLVGAISLLLALYAFQVLPVNYAGAALILLGIALMVTELVTPTFGAVGVAGVVAFIVGSIILFDTDVEGFQISMPLVVSVGVAAGALFSATIVIALRQRQKPVVSGREEMIGAEAEAMIDFDESGRVFTHGEIWTARTQSPVSAGQKLRVKNIEGLILEVEPVEKDEGETR
ncbi:MAG: nodulation protein NfeD [Gammaproteobacteria bacterium]|nr:nodulation protein NfeD [Gammaproteobacteria bacterium]